ncbi:hypothetical protein DERP_004979 [Dermatophagoides pteronyssinus]|uniref:Uncharacterized protein n=1 Tax=Dermatophagoides pteronyssinus TaxID=6956 RepID=A0ABQ8JT56_DERPT|nr:hypothetical protein DERP_004979 [Dermatophagoides pteronyssinus]
MTTTTMIIIKRMRKDFILLDLFQNGHFSDCYIMLYNEINCNYPLNQINSWVLQSHFKKKMDLILT